MQYAMFLVMRDIRGKSVEQPVGHLRQRLHDAAEPFGSNEQFR